MRRSPRRCAALRLSSLVAVTVLAAAGLSSLALGVNAAGAATRHKPKTVVISTVKNAQFGTILVSGTTVYTLKASSTPCNAACTKVWPEVLLPKGVKKAKAGPGVKADKLGTIKRAHGALQVTYAGKPLYKFFLDKTAGQVNGNVSDVWGKWSVFVTPKLAGAAPAASTPTTAAPTPTTAGTTPSRSTSSPTPTTPPPATTTRPPPPTTTTPPPPPTTTTIPSGGGAGF